MPSNARSSSPSMSNSDTLCSSVEMTPSSTPIKKTLTNEEVIKLQNNIRTHSKQLLEEVSYFIDHQLKINDEGERQVPPRIPVRPRLPIFWVKSFNFLKSEADSINHMDPFLNFLPNSIQMKLIADFGPRDSDPRVDENGRLTETQQSLDQEIHQFYYDIVDYIRRMWKYERYFPVLPHAYYMTLLTFQRRTENATEDIKKMVFDIPENMQIYIASQFPGNDFVKEYVVKCTRHHYQYLYREHEHLHQSVPIPSVFVHNNGL